MNVENLMQLTYPADKSIIAQLTLDEKMFWYSMQDPRTMIFLGDNPDFKRFWKFYYLAPLRLKRWWFSFKRLWRIF